MWLSVALMLIVPPFSAALGQQTNPATNRPVIVLDTSGFWRVHSTLKPPVIRLDEKLLAVKLDRYWLDTDTPTAPAGWTAADFDDGAWLRAPALRSVRSPYLARLCMRGYFRVTDPAKVEGLRLSLDFHGGAAVYLNGRELARAHLPDGAVSDSTPAEDYPLDAFVGAKGELLGSDSRRDADAQRRVALRTRKLTGVAIPAASLRKGVNVLAIEIVRAPYHKVVEDKKQPGSRRIPGGYTLAWNTCEIRRVQLTAESAGGLVAAAARPKGFQVWNGDVLVSDFDLDYGNPAEPLRPIRLVGIRNGCFSGKVVAGSTEPIRGLKAVAGDLAGKAGKIPASAVRVRYGLPWGYQQLVIAYSGESQPYPRRPQLLEALSDEPLAEFPVSANSPARSYLQTPGQPEPVFGAVVPIWVTVQVPKAAAPGKYTGKLTIRADGQPPVSVPVELEVVGWTLPDSQDYRTWVELVQSPDTLALEYDVQPWSDRHFELIARSMDRIGEVGSRVVHVPLLAETNLGNAESMVRWIDKGDGKYDYDFAAMERYLDTAEGHMGRPKIVIAWVWEIYLLKSEEVRKDHLWLKEASTARRDFRGKGPLVTVLDPATGKTRNEHLPRFEDPASRALWKPLLDEVRRRLAKRGLAKALMLGMLNDVRPTKEEVQSFEVIAPGVPWALHAHGGFGAWQKYRLHGLARVSYQATVWGRSFVDSLKDGKRMYGWKQPELIVEYERSREFNSVPPSKWRHYAEYNITGGQRGVGRIGAEYWPVIRDKRGQRKGRVWQRYVHSSWRNLDLHSSLLAPAPQGPVAAARFEAFREGLQECEARIVIEQALTDGSLMARLGDELARRCQSELDERLKFMFRSMSTLRLAGPNYRYAYSWRGTPGVDGHSWFVSSGWQHRSRALYGLAAEVAAKLQDR